MNGVEHEVKGSAIRRLLEMSKRNEGGLLRVSSGVNRYLWDARIAYLIYRQSTS